MTPPAATHVASAPVISVPRAGISTGISRRAFDRRAWSRLRLTLDVVVLAIASCAALFMSRELDGSSANCIVAILFPPSVAALARLRPAPDERLSGTLVEISGRVLGVVSLAAMLGIVVESVLGSTAPLQLPFRLWVFGSVYLGIGRGMLFSVRRQALRSPRLRIPTLIVGAGVIGTQLVHRLVGDAGYGLRPVGFLDADPLLPRDVDTSPLPVLGSPDDLRDVIEQTGAGHVILAFSSEPDHVLVSRVRECEALGVGVSLVPRLYESINERTTLDRVGGLPLLTLRSVDPRGWQFALKHTLDRTVALLAVLVLSPVLVLLAITVKISSPGPILFRQRRVGRDGREFDVLKFRTMRVVPRPTEFVPLDGLAPGGVEGTDRRTWIGRLLRDVSLDELPQLLNVLRGDMSLVGPRPERPQYVQQFSRDVARYGDRHRVKSGITGWAQVHGLRGQTSIADRVEWDNYYIRNWSLRLDLQILLLTIAEVLRFRES